MLMLFKPLKGGGILKANGNLHKQEDCDQIKYILEQDSQDASITK